MWNRDSMEWRIVERLAFPFASGNGIGREERQRLDADNGGKVSFVKVPQRHSRTVAWFYAFQLAKRATVANLGVDRFCQHLVSFISFRVLVAVYVLNLPRLLMKTDGLKNTYLEEVARRVVGSANEAEGGNGDEKGRSLRLKRADVITIETHSDMLIRFEDLNNRLTPCSVRPRRAHTVFTIGWKLTKLRNALTFFRVAIVGRGTIG